MIATQESNILAVSRTVLLIVTSQGNIILPLINVKDIKINNSGIYYADIFQNYNVNGIVVSDASPNWLN